MCGAACAKKHYAWQVGSSPLNLLAPTRTAAAGQNKIAGSQRTCNTCNVGGLCHLATSRPCRPGKHIICYLEQVQCQQVTRYIQPCLCSQPMAYMTLRMKLSCLVPCLPPQVLPEVTLEANPATTLDPAAADNTLPTAEQVLASPSTIASCTAAHLPVGT